MSFTKKQRSLIYQQLSEDLQDFFTSQKLTQHLKHLGNKYSLSKEGRGKLGEEVGLIILGIHPLQKLQSRLQSNLDISEKNSKKIANSVKKQVPDKVKNKIEKLPKPEMLLSQARAKGAGQTGAENIPVPPPPPGSDTPTPSYGGNTDPYREPAEE